MTAPSDSSIALDALDPKAFIIIKGAHMHNLRNIDVAIPRHQLVVVTGLSGSGKSSLIFDTLFVEAQRMYIESLSPYARQFLGKMEKPPVEWIRGLSPAIAIQQRGAHKHPRSTLGTVTELCDYLYLLYARIGTTYSPISGEKVQKDTVSDVVDYIHRQEEGAKVQILYPIDAADPAELHHILHVAQSKGGSRVMQGGQVLPIEACLAGSIVLDLAEPIYGLVDRVVVKKGDQVNQYRIADSVQVAFFEGKGHAVVSIVGEGQRAFSDRFELDGHSFVTPTVSFFNFNTPHGACKTCSGLGQIVGVDPEKVVPNPTLSVADGAVAPWQGPVMRKWLVPLYDIAEKLAFPMHLPYNQLSTEQQKWLWEGYGDFAGIYAFFDFCMTQSTKIQYRVMHARYRGKTICTDCQGNRLRKDAHYVKINGYSIVDLLAMPIEALSTFFACMTLTPWEVSIVQRVEQEIKNRLDYLLQVGLGYLTLNRPVSTLSGGEYQRIKLATALASPLFGTIYILDEPTIGLHPRDTDQLVAMLVALKAQGNTVIVVEHDEAVMAAADTLIEIGPKAGAAGGRLMFQGTLDALRKVSKSYTARYLNGSAEVPFRQRRPWRYSLLMQDASLHNIRGVTLSIPLQVLTVVTGVSGSGKSSLVCKLLYPALLRYFAQQGSAASVIDGSQGGDALLRGDFHCIQGVEMVDQHAIGKSARSNPATYLAIYDYIRDLFAETSEARARGYKTGHFSFNSPKGQCLTCHGDGQQQIEMQFMADIYLTCESCRGSRFKPEICEITYFDKNIAQVLQMTVDQAYCFFSCHLPIRHKLSVLQQVGLGYIQLGQSIRSLSGGEGQRLKLAYYLDKKSNQQSLFFIFDEPTTGLHMHDVDQLMVVLQALVDQGHTVLIIEHHMDVVKSADWLIDMGPGAGEKGGGVTFTGMPEALLQQRENYTADYLRKKMQSLLGS